MSQDAPKFSQEQWEFLATIEAFGRPVHISVVGELVPLKPGPFFELIHQVGKPGWLKETEQDTYHLSGRLPEAIKRKLKKINSPDHINNLLKRIDQLKLRERLNPELLSSLLRRTGSEYETAAMENEMAHEAVKKGDISSALTHINATVSCLSGLSGRPEAEALFVSAVLLQSDLRLRKGEKLVEAPKLLRQARDAADALGDRRSRALADLHLGRFSYVSDNLEGALTAFSAGLHEVEELGDEDILAQSAEFVGLYYFLQGMYKEAIKHFDRAMLSNNSRKDNPAGFFLSYTSGYCAAYLGRFNQAVGIFDFNWRTYKQNSEPALAALFQSALGMALLMMGNKKQALFHLQQAHEESRRIHNPRSTLLAQAGMSYYHFLDGRLEESARIMIQSLAEAAGTDFEVRQYSFPWLLEQLYAFQQLDINFQNPYFPFDREIKRIITGPNIHLRGVAYRILAREAMRISNDLDLVRSNLEISRRYLKRSGDPVELAKTRIEMARCELTAGNRTGAGNLAHEAFQGISISGGALFPDELKFLLEEKSAGPAMQGAQNEVIERLLDIMEEFIPSADLDELLARVAAVSTKFYGAERCGLFWFPETDSGRPPELRVSYNLSNEEVETKDFQPNLNMVIQAYQRNQPLIARTQPDTEEAFDSKTRSALCLPFEIRSRVRGVLYHDCFYNDKCFEFIDQILLKKIAGQMSAYIERIWEYSSLMEKKMHVIPGRYAPLESANDKEIITQNRPMFDLLDKAAQVADSEASVLILGETGVGKELMAQKLHTLSRRSQGPFVVVDMTTIPENLVESELFGHEKGAFTGADRRKQGRIELADQGTLFIDEIGEAPWSIQNKLLRVIQEKTFQRIGGTRPLTSDFRLLAATNRDLAAEVNEGRFREDLYYRLNVVPITIPPLRERGRDIVLLARQFISRYTRKHNRPDLHLSTDNEAALTGYNWPGNVRELQNVIERAVLLAKGETLEINVPQESKANPADLFSDTPTADELFKRYIKFILNKTDGKISGPGGAAEILGMKRTTLYSKMKKLGME